MNTPDDSSGLDPRQTKEVVAQAGGAADSSGEHPGPVATELGRAFREEPGRARPAAPGPADGEASLLDQVRRPTRVSANGLAIAELIAALEILAATPGVRDKRVLSLRLHREGILYVRTGEASGGYRLAMEKSEGAWRVAELAKWTA
jgi:hypothetical protein